ncbi:AraC family transcriptional regulator [Fusibacter sp. 3D3]|uniref:AraC family transcriptional regulator n=1 Tax=Fusibacter sp. 3D3 TaxID=1048380 RepID=UPI000853919C|nr:AraC family transcriptional regulator [Fusibacter sp. 3D3]GAU76672.1 transcriptional regulator, AraC family [Fusibacter sp. 3D3]
MLIDNVVLYDRAHSFELNNPMHPLYYAFDYDERSYQINMEFQHYHRHYEICVFLDDSAGHIIDGDWFDIKCADIVLLRPLLLHKTQYPQGAPNKRLIINFNFPIAIPGLEESYKHLLALFDASTPIYRFEGPEKKIIFSKLNMIYDLTKSSNVLSPLMIHQKFQEFLSLIYLNQSKNVYKKKSLLTTSLAKIYNITSFIHNNYNEQLSLSHISKKFFISDYYLSHQFKKVTGFTLTEYIQITRIQMVQFLLMTTDQDITDIAFQCGFSSFSQFNRVFRKHSNMSPSAFRKQNK